jgi:hypothetical protein
MKVPDPPRFEARRTDGQPIDPQVKTMLERLVNPIDPSVWAQIWSQWVDLMLYGQARGDRPL